MSVWSFVRLVEDFGAHVAFGAHSRIVGDVHFASRLRVRHRQSEIGNDTHSIGSYQYVLALNISVGNGRLPLLVKQKKK